MGARGFAAVYPALRVAHPRLLNLEFHAIDFMDAGDPGTSDLSVLQEGCSYRGNRRVLGRRGGVLVVKIDDTRGGLAFTYFAWNPFLDPKDPVDPFGDTISVIVR